MRKTTLLAVALLAGLLFGGGNASAFEYTSGPGTDWRNCRMQATKDANECFMLSLGYWDDVICGAAWDLDLAGCDKALLRALFF